MGIPDDLSCSHDQFEEDGPVEEYQLLISKHFRMKNVTYSQRDKAGRTRGDGSCCDIKTAG
jgi:hypothetical protein